jgi:transposase
VAAKAVIVEEVERLRWRIWNGKARNAKRSIDRIRKVMSVFKGERSHRTTGNLDYHIENAKHFYSVPFRLLRQEVEARITAKTVEIFHRGKLVATHLRSPRPYRPTTVVEHMPSSHRRYHDSTHERIQREAAAIGADTAVLVEIELRSRRYPEHGFGSCIGILGLRKRYGAERLGAACAKVLTLGTRSCGSTAAIPKNAPESKTAHRRETDQPSLLHDNIRGPGYYHLLHDNLDERRIASPEMFPGSDRLPHLKCSPAVVTVGSRNEADRHGDA